MEELKSYTSYQEYKGALDTELKRTADGFVRIGYLLKLARETDILRESGYANVNEFAQAEYGLDKTMVSRFININDRFSEGGCSDHLMEQYQGMGYAKLAIMLQLPDEINEELTPGYSKSEIQAIKEEVDAEKQITDIEVMLEKKEEWQQDMDSIMAMVLHQILHDDTELFMEVLSAPEDNLMEWLKDLLAPNGESMRSARVQGKGRYFLSIKGHEEDPTVISVRDPQEKESCSWEELTEIVRPYMCPGWKVEEAYKMIYGEEMPEQEKEEIAPVQPQQKKAEPRKQSKVTKAKPKVTKEAETWKKEEVAPVQQEEQLPGQMEVNDYPDVVPEWMQQAQDEQEQENEAKETSEKSENAENTVCETESVEGEVVEEESEEELHKDALLMAQKIVNILGDYEQLPENMADACVADAEELLLIVSKLSIAVKGRNSQ